MNSNKKPSFILAILMLCSITLSKVVVVDVEDLGHYLKHDRKLSNKVSDHKKEDDNEEDPFADTETYGIEGLFTNRNMAEQKKDEDNEEDPFADTPTYGIEGLFTNRNMAEADSGTEAVIDPLDENNEEAPVEPVEEPVEEAPVEPVEEPVEETPEEIESTGFQNRPNSGEKVALWPALCETLYHGSNWGKSDGENSYFTLGSKSYLCPEYSRRDDLTRSEFDAEVKESPCPQLVAEDSRGLKWAPVIVQTTFGEIPGKVRYFDDSKKTRSTGVFSYMGRSYRGPVMAWLC